MAEIFLKLDEPGVDGECTDDAHPDWIELDSIQQGMGQAVSAPSSTGGRSAGRVSMSEFTVSKPLDKASLDLYLHCCKGTHFKKVIVALHEASGDKHKYYEVNMADVIISGISYSSGGDKPTESLSLNFGKIRWEYTPIKQDGSKGDKVGPQGWNLETNAKW